MDIFLVNSLNCSPTLLFDELNHLFKTPYSTVKEFKKILLNHDLVYNDHKLYYMHKLILQGQVKDRKLCYTAEEFFQKVAERRLTEIL